MFVWRTEIYPGESLPSFLFRLSKLNHYPTPELLYIACRIHSNILSRAKKQWTNPSQASAYRTLSELTGIPIFHLYQASENSFSQIMQYPGNNLHYLFFEDGNKFTIPVSPRQIHSFHYADTQFCPVCLQENAYHHRDWLFKSKSVCLRHKLMLVHRCPNCGHKIHIHNTISKRCPDCKFDLTQSPSIPITDDKMGLIGQKIIHGWLNEQDNNFQLPDEPPSTLHRVLVGMVSALRYVNYGTGASPKVPHISYEVPSRRYATYTATIQGLMNWPNGFFSYLDILRHTTGKNTGLVSQDFGIFYAIWLQREWKYPEFQFLQDAFDQYIYENYPLSRSLIYQSRFKNSATLKKHHQFMTKKDVLDFLGIGIVRLERCIRLGYLVEHTNSSAGESATWFERNSVLSLRKILNNQYITLKHAAAELGVSKKVISDLIDMGKLKTIRHPLKKEGQEFQLSLASVIDYKDRLTALIVGKHPPEATQTMSLLAVSRSLSGHGVGLAQVIQFIVDKNVVLYGAKHQSAHLFMPLSAVEILKKRVKERSLYITRQQIAAMKNVKLETVTQWVNMGLLFPAKTTRQGMYFDKSMVKSFLEVYVFTSEAAEILEVGVLAVQKWVRAGRLTPISGPSVNSRHRYIFRRSDIEKLRPEQRLTAPQLAEKIGISRSQLWQWIKKEKIIPISGPGIDGSKHYLFLQDDIGNLTNSR